MIGFCVIDSLDQLSREYPTNSSVKELQKFLSKPIWTVDVKQKLLNLLTALLKDCDLTEVVAEKFSPLLLELLHRLSQDSSKLPLFSVLSKLIGRFTVATNFAYECFNANLFSSKSIIEDIADKSEAQHNFIVSCFVFINFNTKFFKNSFDWSFIVNFFNHQNKLCGWIALGIYSILLNLDQTSLNNLLRNFSSEERIKFTVKCFELCEPRSLKFINSSVRYEDGESETRLLLDSDLSANIVCINGILLQKLNSSTKESSFVLLPSVKENLHSVAFGVSLAKPILVEGPMGCGKSALIRHLAQLTGRFNQPEVITIQISDQVDSKFLLGSYICSDIPGEFMFNIGPLLKAIKHGGWVILEDIDCASSEVISMLFSIIETKSASSIPGCENKIDKYNSNFRIFFTRRTNSADVFGGNLMHMLEKACFKVSMKNLDSSEIYQLISSRWSNLSSIVLRIVDVYEALLGVENLRSKRHITLRDLMKWCHRLSKYFKLNAKETSQFAFLDAVDCFVDFNHQFEFKVKISNIFGANLNISKSQCEHLIRDRTPDVEITETSITIGRQLVPRDKVTNCQQNFAFTNQSLMLLEKLFVCVINNEPALLCGETGVGKTSCIQYLASLFGKHLTVINMNQQSDSVELFGGYKPIDNKFLLASYKNEYVELFNKTFDSKKNSVFLEKFSQVFIQQDWNTLLAIMLHVCKNAPAKCSSEENLLNRWKRLEEKLKKIEKILVNKNQLTFSFVEGALTHAVRTGQWVLLDEINLAEYETLQSLLSLLENDSMFVLFEKSSTDQSIHVHKDFRLFACMNPATDVGKRELPIGIQNRFTEFYISEISDQTQLRVIVHAYIGSQVSPFIVEAIVNFYTQIKFDAANTLKDINGYKPVFSLRNLCRALRVAKFNSFNSMNRSLYEAFCLAFLTNLDQESYAFVEKKIETVIFPKVKIANLLKVPIDVSNRADFTVIENYPIRKGPNEIFIDETYILTPTVCKNLKDICRIISVGQTFPILLQGETSVGKTSLIQWLAKATGNVCYRVNNHEHTDLQEYIGSYCSDENGQIVFKEGILINAMRNGHWLILDELNLAPTEVLEALNRVLDDNREYFIPETQEVVKAHSRFLLFATQNPPGRYGGRKILSRAFRNRFIELNFCEIPSGELEVILYKKCSLPLAYAKRMLSVLLELQRCRSKSDIFAGKYGLITLRDLFRWGNRYRKFSNTVTVKFYDWNLFLANQGYMLLAGRARKAEEVQLIKEILEKRFKCKISLEDIFYKIHFKDKTEFSIVWTKAFKRLASLIQNAIRFEEPILLVGETGCGKTTICQYFSSIMGKQLRIINCHMNTEGGDFLGNLRPNRNLSNDPNAPLFEWVDGPLIKAMKEGQYLLVDEISLADDSVLERLNSVLELERTIFLAENIKTPLIIADPAFRYFATMNPGGDYGKKELSPALRDRFTEIWCPVYEDMADIKQIINLSLEIKTCQAKEKVSEQICNFISWFDRLVFNSKNMAYSVRDILSWVNFINQTNCFQKSLNLRDAFVNGAYLVFVDSIGASNIHRVHQNHSTIKTECEAYLQKLATQLPLDKAVNLRIDRIRYLQIGPFKIEKSSTNQSVSYFWESSGVNLNLKRILRALQLDKPILLEGVPGVGKTSLIQALAAVTGHELLRINLSDQTDISDLFGCDLPMEGENTAGKFVFRDGPLLTALKSEKTWILLDELNLASQTVLEGLNACLDHRGEIYISELNQVFKINKSQNRIFASQNPFSMDGTRKGLPKSFLNRFTLVYIDSLKSEDFEVIMKSLYPSIEAELIRKMITINDRIFSKSLFNPSFAKKGGPFEFNLRDLLRWAEVTSKNHRLMGRNAPELFFDLIYTNKMRTTDDRSKMKTLCEEEFNYERNTNSLPFFLNDNLVQCGYSTLIRCNKQQSEMQELCFVFEPHKPIIESIMKCIEMKWLAILIGNTGCGKTHLLKMLAHICGQKLNIISVNSEMDTTDLLGGFEQKDFSNDLECLQKDILITCQERLRSNYKNFPLISSYLKLMNDLKLSIISANMSDRLKMKISILRTVLKLFPATDERLNQLQSRLDTLDQANHKALNGAFEWIDSKLIKSVENGDWLLIDNGNLLNPSVLDRLNSLLETNGKLMVNEKGSADGQITCIEPHSNFRMFIAMNPQHGELSRAMRNRGIEIVFLEPFGEEEMRQVITRYNLKIDHPLPSVDYSLFFKFIFETISKSQNAIELKNIEPAILEAKPLTLKPISINHIIPSSVVYFALQDSQVLELTSENTPLNSTKLRLFLESCSFSGMNIRIYTILNYLVLPHNKTQFEQFKIRFMALCKKIKALIDPNLFYLIQKFPADFREHQFLWSLFLNRKEIDDNARKIWNDSLNSFHLALFWNDLKQRLSKDSDSLLSLPRHPQINNLSAHIEDEYLKSSIFLNFVQDLLPEIITEVLAIVPCDELTIRIRSILVWTYHLMQVCYNLSQTNYRKQIVDTLKPVWFIWDEKVAKFAVYRENDENFQATRNLCRLTFTNTGEKSQPFDKRKYRFIQNLANNFVRFRSPEAVKNFLQLLKHLDSLLIMMNSKKVTDWKWYNEVSLEVADQLFTFHQSEIGELNLEGIEDRIQSILHRKSANSNIIEPSPFIDSIVATEIIKSFVCDSANLDEILNLVRNNSIVISPWLLFYTRALLTKPVNGNCYTDLLVSAMGNINRSLSVSSIIDHFNAKPEHISSSIVSFRDKFRNLTFESIPILSLFCFHLHQTDCITIEQFFNKRTTLEFYKDFLINNYESLKTQNNVPLEHLVAMTKYFHLHSKDQFFHLGNPPSNFTEKCLYMATIGCHLARSSVADFPIDPVVRNQIKRQNHQLEGELIQVECDLRLQINQHKYGFNTAEFNCGLLRKLQQRLAENKTKMAKLANDGCRVDASKYSELKSDIGQFCDSMLDLASLKTRCDRLAALIKNGDQTALDQELSESLNYQQSLARFLEHLDETYPEYNDLTSVFMVGATLVLKAIQLMVYKLASARNTRQIFGNSTLLPKLVSMCNNFVSVYCPHEIGEFILKKNSLLTFTKICESLGLDEKYVTTSLLKSVFLEIENSLLLGFDKTTLFDPYTKVVDIFVQWWKKIKQSEEDEMLKNEALFHFKLEDEPDDEKIRMVFPSFEDKFEDLIHDNLFGTPESGSKKTDPKMVELNVTKDTLLFIISSHMKLIAFFNSDNMDLTVDFLKPYMIRYKLLSDIFKRTSGFIDLNAENELVEGHILVNQYLLNINQQHSGPINVYRESSMSQTQACHRVLQRLKSKITDELLPQFENHPTLVKLLKIIERIYQIEVNSSLLSFATGLELILKTSDEWQQIAHRGISLVDHLNEITELLVEWRKLEIKHWTGCLETITERINEKEMINWWFIFYVTLESTINTQREQLMDELVNSVKKYMENSSLGQFQIRLDILKSFIYQLRFNKTTICQVSSKILTTLENLHRFYDHFSPSISKTINSEKVTIEKEIQEFVKISKWNPNNFWSLKESLHKSHRQLYGYMRKFEQHLFKPANASFIFERNLNPKSWRLVVDIKLSPLKFEADFGSAEEFKFLANHKSYIEKSNRLCLRSIKRSSKSLVGKVSILEKFNIELIENLQHYSSLKVPETKDLEKWKKVVGQIQNKKRRALSDLFKALTMFGLSFRKGLIHYDAVDMNQHIYSIKPLLELDCFGQNSRENIKSCNDYFYKCLWGYMRFVANNENPNEQLSFDMLERIKGFTSELTRTVMNMRRLTSDSMADFETIFKYYSQMKQQFGEQNNTIMVYAEMKTNFWRISNFSMKLLSFCIRSKIVFNSLKTNANTVLVIDGSPADFTSIETDKFDQIISDLKQICSGIKFRDSLFFTNNHVEKLSQVVSQLSSSLQSIEALFESSPCLASVNKEHLKYFRKEMLEISQKIEIFKCIEQRNTQVPFCTADQVHQSNRICNLTMKSLLLSIEKVYSLFNNQPESDDEVSTNKTLIKNPMLSKALPLFNTERIIKQLKQFFKCINSSPPECSKWNHSLISTLTCVMDTYISLYQYVLIISFGSIKSANKLLHILLTLFNDLLADGFCIPPEPKESTEKDQLKKTQENSGFGEGDTSQAQDVSDRLDCQDQLDELKKDGAENDVDDDTPPEASDAGVEMDYDFDGNETGDNQTEEKDNDAEDSDEEEENKDLDEKMGNVDNEDEMLDEKIWGDDDDEESDLDDLNEDTETSGGKDNVESEMVANEENKDLAKNKDDEDQPDSNENEEEKEEKLNELEDDAMGDEYQNENPDIYKNNEAEAKPADEMQLPEDMNLDLDSEDGEEDGDEEQDADDDQHENGQQDEDIDEEGGMPEDIEDTNVEDQTNDDGDDKMNVDTEADTVDNPEEEQKNEQNITGQNEKPSEGSDQSVVDSEVNNAVSDQQQEDNDKEKKGENTSKSCSNEQDKLSSNFKENTDGSKDQCEEQQTLSKSSKHSRSLAEEVMSKVKRQRIMNSSEDKPINREEGKESDSYRHVDNADKANELAVDIADPEDKQQSKQDLERNVELVEEKELENTEDKPIDLNENRKRIKTEDKSSVDVGQDAEMKIGGEFVQTSTVSRNPESTFNNPTSVEWRREAVDVEDVNLIEDTLEGVDPAAIEMWKECSKNIDQLVYELCNELQLVLEPTKCAKFKGDFKSGKRLNMRKVIAYIASDFKKDKIWLRRSKPSKRQYQIIIGVDDSFSMSDNRSKQMAFESLILLGKSLSIIESGALSVLSFGEDVRILHSFKEPFTDQSALKMFSKFQFNQQKTKITELIKCSLSLFANSRQATRSSASNIYQLLLIVSDGRGIFSEGQENVKREIRKLKQMGIFSVFIIMDNPEHKNSILDIRVPVFDDQGKIRIESYMENFPFPFYVILQNINSMPVILGESLKQWFELITHENN